MVALDLSGQKFGRLTAIRYFENRGNERHWLCICECGKESIVSRANLKSGIVKSCGCLRTDRTSETHKTHGGCGSRIYTIAVNILQRCNNPKSRQYVDYGGRGIKCMLGNTVSDVYKELLKIDGYNESLTIDRIDVNGHYEHGNIRWTTVSEQGYNQRKKSTNTSGTTGVCWIEQKQKWIASIRINGKQKSKSFTNKEDAIEWRKQKELEIYGYNK